MSHHAGEDVERNRKALADFADTMKNNPDKKKLDELLKQSAAEEKLGATGEFPRGQISERDEGQLKMAVSSDPKTRTVILNFGKRIEWIGFSPEEARGLARILLNHANKFEA